MNAIDDFLRRSDDMIDDYGWMVMSVVPDHDGPSLKVPFAYTVGLTAYGYAELLVAGLPPEFGHRLLNDLARRVYDKAVRFAPGQRIDDLFKGHDLVIVEGNPPAVLKPRVAYAIYGRKRVRVQQVVWPDPYDRFPWDSGYAMDTAAQPLIRSQRQQRIT